MHRRGAELAAKLFGDDDALTTYATPGRFGSRLEMISGFMRALAPPGSPPPIRALQIVRGLPRAAAALKGQVAAQCEVGAMLKTSVHLRIRVELIDRCANRALLRHVLISLGMKT